eukprot:gene8386-17292_t
MISSITIPLLETPKKWSVNSYGDNYNSACHKMRHGNDLPYTCGAVEICPRRWIYWEASNNMIQLTEFWLDRDLVDNSVFLSVTGIPLSIQIFTLKLPVLSAEGISVVMCVAMTDGQLVQLCLRSLRTDLSLLACLVDLEEGDAVRIGSDRNLPSTAQMWSGSAWLQTLPQERAALCAQWFRVDDDSDSVCLVVGLAGGGALVARWETGTGTNGSLHEGILRDLSGFQAIWSGLVGAPTMPDTVDVAVLPPSQCHAGGLRESLLLSVSATGMLRVWGLEGKTCNVQLDLISSASPQGISGASDVCIEDACMDLACPNGDLILAVVAMDCRLNGRRRWMVHVLTSTVASGGMDLCLCGSLSPPSSPVGVASMPPALVDMKISVSSDRVEVFALWTVRGVDIPVGYLLPSPSDSQGWMQLRNSQCAMELPPVLFETAGSALCPVNNYTYFLPEGVTASVRSSPDTLDENLLLQLDVEDVKRLYLQALMFQRLGAYSGFSTQLLSHVLAFDVAEAKGQTAFTALLRDHFLSSTPVLAGDRLSRQAILGGILDSCTAIATAIETETYDNDSDNGIHSGGMKYVDKTTPSTRGREVFLLAFQQIIRLCDRRYANEMESSSGRSRERGTVTRTTTPTEASSAKSTCGGVGSVGGTLYSMAVVRRGRMNIALHLPVTATRVEDGNKNGKVNDASTVRNQTQSSAICEYLLQSVRATVSVTRRWGTLDVALEQHIHKHSEMSPSNSGWLVEEFMCMSRAILSSRPEDVDANHLLSQISEVRTSRPSWLEVIDLLMDSSGDSSGGISVVSSSRSLETALVLRWPIGSLLPVAVQSGSEPGLALGGTSGARLISEICLATVQSNHMQTKTVSLVLALLSDDHPLGFGLPAEIRKQIREELMPKAVVAFLYQSFLMWMHRLIPHIGTALRAVIDIETEEPLAEDFATISSLQSVSHSFARGNAQTQMQSSPFSPSANITSDRERTATMSMMYVVEGGTQSSSTLWASLWLSCAPRVLSCVSLNNVTSLNAYWTAVSRACIAVLSPSCVGLLAVFLRRTGQFGVLSRMLSLVRWGQSWKSPNTNSNMSRGLLANALTVPLSVYSPGRASFEINEITVPFADILMTLGDGLFRQRTDSLLALASLQDALDWLAEQGSRGCLDGSAHNNCLATVNKWAEVLLDTAPSVDCSGVSSSNRFIIRGDVDGVLPSPGETSTRDIVSMWFTNLIASLGSQSVSVEVMDRVCCIGEALSRAAASPILGILLRCLWDDVHGESTPSHPNWRCLSSLLQHCPDMVLAILRLTHHRRVWEMLERAQILLSTYELSRGCMSIALPAAYASVQSAATVIQVWTSVSIQGSDSTSTVTATSEALRDSITRELIQELKMSWLSVFSSSLNVGLLDHSLQAVRYLAGMSAVLSDDGTVKWRDLLRTLVGRACDTGRLGWMCSLPSPLMGIVFNVDHVVGNGGDLMNSLDITHNTTSIDIIDATLYELECLAKSSEVLPTIPEDSTGGAGAIDYYECLSVFLLSRGDYREAARVQYLLEQRIAVNEVNGSTATSLCARRDALVVSCISLSMLPAKQTAVVHRPLPIAEDVDAVLSVRDVSKERLRLCSLGNMRFNLAVTTGRTKLDTITGIESCEGELKHLVQQLCSRGIDLHLDGEGNGVELVLGALSLCSLWRTVMSEDILIDSSGRGSSVRNEKDFSDSLMSSVAALTKMCAFDDELSSFSDATDATGRSWDMWRPSARETRAPSSASFPGDSWGWSILSQSIAAFDRHDRTCAWRTVFDSIVSNHRFASTPLCLMRFETEAAAAAERDPWALVDCLRAKGRLVEACDVSLQVLQRSLWSKNKQPRIFLSYRHLDLLLLACNRVLLVDDDNCMHDNIHREVDMRELDDRYADLQRALQQHFKMLYLAE